MQQNLYMLRVLPAQGKLVLPQVTQIGCKASLRRSRFWMSRNFGGALRDIQKTAARETSVKPHSRVILSNQKSWVLTQFATT